MHQPSHKKLNRVLASLLLLMSILISSPVFGQLPEPDSTLGRGERVRLSIANLENTEEWQVGKLSRLGSSSVTIVTSGKDRELTVMFADIDGFQRSLGRDSRRGVQWMGGGAAFGFVIGAGLTLLSSDDLPDGSRGNWVTAGVGFAAIGAVVAGIIGFQERWGDVAFGASVSMVTRPMVRAKATF
jgi:hypothetical protein